MLIDLQYDEALLMKSTVVHAAEELDDHSGLQTTPYLRKTKIVGKAGAQSHGRLLAV